MGKGIKVRTALAYLNETRADDMEANDNALEMVRRIATGRIPVSTYRRIQSIKILYELRGTSNPIPETTYKVQQ